MSSTQPGPAPPATSPPPPSVHFTHNTDLEPSEEYLASVPRLRPVLANPQIVKTFHGFDAVANEKQRKLWRIGIASLALAGVGLLGIATKLMLVGLGHGDHPPSPWWRDAPTLLTVTSEALLLVAIVVALHPRFARTRRAWLTARFMTERIRQWQFQLLLDGELLARATRSPKTFASERGRRWAALMAVAPSAEGALESFLASEDPGLLHPVTEGDGGPVDEETCRVWRDLRIEKQVAYFQLRREQLAAKDEWTEAIAKWTLLSALMLPVAQLALFLFERGGLALSHAPSIVLSAVALMLVVLSTVTRVYREAIGVTEQRDRYESKFVQLVRLRRAFEEAPSMTAKREAMREVELLEVEEMREFLRQMRKSSFLF